MTPVLCMMLHRLIEVTRNKEITSKHCSDNSQHSDQSVTTKQAHKILLTVHSWFENTKYVQVQNSHRQIAMSKY